MGGNGQDMCRGMLAFAEQNGVIVLAPTFNYNPDYVNPEVIRLEDVKIAAKINEIVPAFEQFSHLQLKDRYLLYGFSRGAQVVHRYSLLYPAKVLGVAVLSAGSYTLPFATNRTTNEPLPWPYGIADLQKYIGKPFDRADFLKVHFWLEVGALDTDPKGVSRSWDALLGTNRLERSKNFYQSLKLAEAQAQWTVIPDTGHGDTAAMHLPALNFFTDLLRQAS